MVVLLLILQMIAFFNIKGLNSMPMLLSCVTLLVLAIVFLNKRSKRKYKG
jgi:hypothetical protein